jgi:hypothetical protein
MTIISKWVNSKLITKWAKLSAITFIVSFVTITIGIVLIVSTRIFHNMEDLRDAQLWNYFFDAYMRRVLFDQILGCIFLSVCVATKKIYDR